VMRARVDAIGVGAETVLTDDPVLTAREVFRERPLARVIFDRRGRVPASAAVFSTSADGPIRVVRAELAEAMRELADEGIHSLLLEGGAALHAAVWDAGLVDYVQLYVAPSWLGEAGVRWLDGRAFSTMDLHHRRVEPLGPDVLIEGYVHRPH
jgi:diaminohydroxyphosphoribosylaminopyrimidine deaminase/5-amino-6-(5-phosphoribosylamino)uracil reductase